MRKLFYFFVFLAFLLSANAQELKYRIGAGLGINAIDLQNIDYSNSPSCGMFEGWNVGGGLAYNLKKKGLSMNISLILSRIRFKSNKIPANLEPSDYTENDRFFLEIPLTIEYNFKIPHFLTFYGETGPKPVFTLGKRKMFNGEYILQPITLQWTLGGGIRIGKHWKLGYQRDFWMTNGVKELKEGNLYVGNKKKCTDNLLFSYYF